jgi:hypothetical protein
MEQELNMLVNASTQKQDKAFIEANTIAATLEEISNQHLIPVFIKDNEPLISQTEFVQSTLDFVKDVFAGETILTPSIRLSHPVKSRIPEAKYKSASDLQEWEKTIYYERMMFTIEIPSIADEINGNTLSLTVGGVKSYTCDNLYSRKGSDEHFKIFIGFENTVCTNLCVWTDGLLGDLKVQNLGQLKGSIGTLLQNYNASHHMFILQQFAEHIISEQQFANLIGRCRLYPYLSQKEKENVVPMLFGDQQLGTVCRDYFRDNNFSKDGNGQIDLWRLYNLFTGANKSTYIDQFMNRSANAFSFVYSILQSIKEKQTNWYLN